MASVLGVTALLGAMRCGAGDPPPQGDDGGSGGGMNGITSPVKHRTSGVGGFSRFSVLLTMLLLVLGLAGTASAQSNASELEDGGAPYLILALSMDTYEVRITDAGSGKISVSVTNISPFPTVSLGSQSADDSAGYYPGAAHSELVFTDPNNGFLVGVYIGTSGTDSIGCGAYDCELVFGMDASDDIYGDTGTGTVMLIFGGDGADSIVADDEDDTIFAGFRSIAYNGTGYDFVDGGGGIDTILCDNLADGSLVYAGDGNDTVVGGTRIDEIYGEDGCDDIWGNDASDIISGGPQDDFLRGGSGDDVIDGDSGKDVIDGGAGEDYLSGGSGNDYVHDMDSSGGNTLLGESEQDTIHCRDIDDSDDYDGGTENDTLWVDSGDNELSISGTNSYSFVATPPMGYASAGALDAFENFGRNTHWGPASVNRSC